MSFCSTIEHRRSGQFLSLALHTIAMADPIMRIEDARYEAREGRKKSRRPSRKNESKQFDLFPLTKEQAESFAGFAKTLRYFLESYQEDVIKTKPKDNRKMWGPGGRLHDLEYCDYEFYDFWYHMIRDLSPEVWETRVKELEKIGENSIVEDYEPSIKFLYQINARALWEHESHRRGCF